MGSEIHTLMDSDEEVRSRYGSRAAISRKGRFALVHLDDPTAELIRSRTETFEPDDFFDDDCPLCVIARAGGVFVYDDYPDDEDDEIVIE